MQHEKERAMNEGSAWETALSLAVEKTRTQLEQKRSLMDEQKREWQHAIT